ncbi:xanthine dehydrogenase accessory factor [Actinoalloteichus cyanogriseus DSM 43889]|uniref:Xanthine dehydrogenase accessory factor n=1 Tax=Actinoalloteichus caeruleus DSM 43889 TaxID=1120930 RepID=A0ABT1JB85_ACTCY|nr:xanthine dehydrogenase accessory factor [Actinoalloteichus caeruleus DSM 43889]
MGNTVSDLVEHLAGISGAGVPFALVSLVEATGGSPRRLGLALVVESDGQVTGGVAGGCVEAAVYAWAEQALATGRCLRRRVAASGGDILAPTASCGGELEVFVRRCSGEGHPELLALREANRRDQEAVLVTVVDEDHPLAGQAVTVLGAPSGAPGGDRQPGRPHPHGTLGDRAADRAATGRAREWLTARRPGRHRLPTVGGGEVEVLVETHAAPDRLVLIGSTVHADPLARLGRLLGYHVTVCDPRPLFTTARRFPAAHDVVVDWPHRYLAGQRLTGRDAVCLLTHDSRVDVPALVVALRGPAGYVGALGSRSTHRRRVGELRGRGLGDRELARLRAPVGLDLGGDRPEETAVSVAAEIIACRAGGSGRPLTFLDGPVHSAAPRTAWTRQAPHQPTRRTGPQCGTGEGTR